MEENLGVDFDCNYEFVDGDLKIVTEKENVIQSVYNRLNTDFDTMENFYNVYGSNLRKFCGEKIDDIMLQFIEIETKTSLQQDSLMEDAEVSVTKQDGKPLINIYKKFDDNTDLSLTLIITEDEGVDLLAS